MDEQVITFTDEETERIHHPYDDAIVITLLIANYTTRRVLMDNGSLMDILYYPYFQQMRLGRDQLRLVNSPLVGFGGMRVQPVCTVTLSVVVGAYPQQVTKDVNFLMVDFSSSYNAIIERPTLNSWKAITSPTTYLSSSDRARGRTSTRRPTSSKRMLLSHVGHGRASSDDEY